MFLTGMFCLPLSIAFAVIGSIAKKFKTAIVWFIVGAIAFTHFLWYFNILGGSLGTKIGKYEPPAWYSFFPYSMIGVVLFIGLWLFFDRKRMKKGQPPPLPKQ